MEPVYRNYSDEQAEVASKIEEVTAEADKMLALTVYRTDIPSEPDREKLRELAIASYGPNNTITDELLVGIAPMVQQTIKILSVNAGQIKNGLVTLYNTQKVLYEGLYRVFQLSEMANTKLDSQGVVLNDTNTGVGRLLQEMASVRLELQQIKAGQVAETMDVETESRGIASLNDKFDSFTSEFNNWHAKDTEIARLAAQVEQKDREAYEYERQRAEAAQTLANLNNELNQARSTLQKNASVLGEKEYEVSQLMYNNQQLVGQLEAATMEDPNAISAQNLLTDQQKQYQLALFSSKSAYEELQAQYDKTLREKTEAENKAREQEQRAGLLQIQYNDAESRAGKAKQLSDEKGQLQDANLLLIQQKSTADARADRATNENKTLKERAATDTNAALSKVQNERTQATIERDQAQQELEAAKRRITALEIEERAATQKKEIDTQARKRLEDQLLELTEKELTEKRRLEEEMRKLKEEIRVAQSQIVLHEKQPISSDETEEIERLQREKEVATRKLQDKAKEIEDERALYKKQIETVKKAQIEASGETKKIYAELEKQLSETRVALEKEKTANSTTLKAKNMTQLQLSYGYGEWKLTEQKIHAHYDQTFVLPLYQVQKLISDMNAVLKKSATVKVDTLFLPKLGLQTRLASKWSLDETELLKGLQLASRVDGEFTATVAFYSLPTSAFPQGELRQVITHPGVNEFALPERRVIAINMDYPLDRLKVALTGAVFRTIPVRGLVEYIVRSKHDKWPVAVLAKQEYAITDTDGLRYMSVVDADVGPATLKCHVVGSGYVQLDAIWITRDTADGRGFNFASLMGSQRK